MGIYIATPTTVEHGALAPQNDNPETRLHQTPGTPESPVNPVRLTITPGQPKPVNRPPCNEPPYLHDADDLRIASPSRRYGRTASTEPPPAITVMAFAPRSTARSASDLADRMTLLRPSPVVPTTDHRRNGRMPARYLCIRVFHREDTRALGRRAVP